MILTISVLYKILLVFLGNSKYIHHFLQSVCNQYLPLQLETTLVSFLPTFHVIVVLYVTLTLKSPLDNAVNFAFIVQHILKNLRGE